MPSESPAILYYVNGDGAGHWQRAKALLPLLQVPCVAISERMVDLPPAWKHVVSPSGLPPLRAQADTRLADDVLHVPYAARAAYLPRLQAVTALCAAHNVQMAVIDVCVETALCMRLAGIPYYYMRMNGTRNDAAHVQAYRAACGLLASYPDVLEEPDIPVWMRKKTHYTGGIVCSGAARVRRPVSQSPKPYALVMRGRGSSRITMQHIRQAASQVPTLYWLGIGFDDGETGHNYCVMPPSDAAGCYMQNAEVIIANTGNNTVLETGMLQKPFITLPEPRYFDEQVNKARQLQALGLAEVLQDWPIHAHAWQQHLEAARAQPVQRWRDIVCADGAQRMASHIIEGYRRLTAD